MIKRVEVNYRGIFQKTLAKKIGGDIVLIASRMGRVAFSNGRYSDAPERNGIPCKYFAFVSPDLTEAELEAECGAKLDIDAADVSVVLDDAMMKGVEPWGWHGIRPINEKIGDGGCLFVVSGRAPSDFVGNVERRPFSYRLAVLEGEASFSGLWVFQDDLTHERVLGAIAAVDPGIIEIEAVEEFLLARTGEERRSAAARAAHDAVLARTTTVAPGDGIEWPHAIPELPAWSMFGEGVVVAAVPRRAELVPGGQARNPMFSRGTSKTQRPVVQFDICTKCTLCWLACPDGAFDPTADGLYDVNYEYCTGCGKCAAVCPVANCMVMVDELHFTDTASPWEHFVHDSGAYAKWLDEKRSAPRVAYPYVTGSAPPGTVTRLAPAARTGRGAVTE